MAGKSFKYKDNAHKTYIYLHDNAAVFRYGSYDACWSVTGTHNKMAIVNADYPAKDKIKEAIFRHKTWVPGSGYQYKDLPKKCDSLFISHSCKTPRDIIRKSGYKIVNDPDAADYIVTPSDKSVKWENEGCNVVVCNDDKLFLYSIERMQTGRRGAVRGNDCLSDDEVDYVKSLLAKTFDSSYEVYFMPDMRSFIVSFCPKIKEFEEIVCETRPNAKYISNTFLELDSVSEINPETLQIWDKMEKDVFARSVVNSNWREYPFTIKNLVELRGFFLRTNYSAYDEMVRSLDSLCDSSSVTVKDWNMSQKLFMIHFGVSETGGYVDKNIFDNLNYTQRGYVNCRFAVKPFILQENDDFEIPISEIKSKF